MAKETILVVDDEEDILELVRYNLNKDGYKITCALTGEDALEKARSETFDLIILDLMLTGHRRARGDTQTQRQSKDPQCAGGHADGQGRGVGCRCRFGTRRGRLHNQAIQPPNSDRARASGVASQNSRSRRRHHNYPDSRF